MSKLEFYLAPFGLSRIANPSVLLRLELFNGGLAAGWHFIKVYMEKKKGRKKNPGTLPTHAFCLERIALPTWGMRRTCHS